jgi:hypothetical protein
MTILWLYLFILKSGSFGAAVPETLILLEKPP